MQRESPEEYEAQHERSRAAQELMQDAMNMTMAPTVTTLAGRLRN